jgi:hypothetical protein
MIEFRKCEICGRPLEGPEAEQVQVDKRRLDPAAGAVLQRELPRDLDPDAVCDECIEEYRRRTGQADPTEGPSH